ncbi:MAG: DUF3868 domain-containing protein [Rikenellaceae bacterium]
MKRYYIILVALMALQGSLNAQNRLGAEVTVERLNYEADMVYVDLKFDLSALKIGAQKSVVLTPKLHKEDSDKELASIIVKSRGGVKSHERAVVLNNPDTMIFETTPYKTIEFFGEQKCESTHYRVSIPYERWMVNSQLYVDCSTYGCCQREDSGMIVPSDNILLIDIPVVDDYQVVADVEMIKPEKVAVKRRDIAYSAELVFKVNSTYLDPDLANNRKDLDSIDEMMQSVMSDSDYTITRINIIGYASPEGSLSANMKLSEGRATALERLMEQKYKSIPSKLYSVKYGGENWDELYKIVSESDLAERDEVLGIINNISVENGRETKLMALNRGATYRYMLENFFPHVRLVVVDVEYNVDAYDLDRIAELIDTKPQNLSLEEMYRLSESYNMGDDEFEKIFLTAVKVFPDDEVAQNNALVTEIRGGNLERVEAVAGLVDRETQSAELANSLGVYYLLIGDLQAAQSVLQRAQDLGSTRAEGNMVQLSKRAENLKFQRESEEFRVKIYGE